MQQEGRVIVFSSHRFAGKLLGTTIILTVFLTLMAPRALAETEEEMIERAAVKLKLEKYHEAAAILEEAMRKFPASVEVARLRAEAYEGKKASDEELKDAYNGLIKVLQMKKVIEGSLSLKEQKLLQETKEKLTGAGGSDEVVKALEKFFREGAKICRSLARAHKDTQARYVFGRLSALSRSKEFQAEFKKLAAELKYTPPAVGRLAPRAQGGTAKEIKKLLSDAQKALRSSDFDKARVSCKAVLEMDPRHAEAKAILCDIADKSKDKAATIRYGLDYLVLSPHLQTVRRAKTIEKRLHKASPVMGRFFDLTAEVAGEICDLVRTYVREKKDAPLERAFEQLARLTHRTKNVDSVFSKARSYLRGVMPWHKVTESTFLGGEIQQGRALAYDDVIVKGSFTIQFRFQIEGTIPAALTGGPTEMPAIVILVWGDMKPTKETGTAFVRVIALPVYKKVNMYRFSRHSGSSGGYPGGPPGSYGPRSGTEEFSRGPYAGPTFASGTWYKMRLDYVHKKGGTCKMVVSINGKKVGNVTVPGHVSPARTGVVGIARQKYESVNLKDVYIVP